MDVSLINTLKTVDTIQDAYEAGNSADFAAGIAKLTAMVAMSVAAEAMIRRGWALIRLGYAHLVTHNASSIKSCCDFARRYF